MPANKNAMTRYALLDHLLQDRRKNWSIQDMTDYLAEHLPEYGSEPVTRRMVEKDLQYLEYDSPFEVEFERFKVDAPTKSGDGVYKKPCLRYADSTFSIFHKALSEDERSLLASVPGMWLIECDRQLRIYKNTQICSFGCKFGCRYNKSLIIRLYCGERGIRTPGASQHGSFQDCCNRPLYHLSLGLALQDAKL